MLNFVVLLTSTLRIFVLMILFFGMMANTATFAGSLTAEVDKSASNLDEPFEITLQIQGSLSGDVLVPETQDFEFTQAGQSTNISIINGSMTKELVLTYLARPTKEGDLTIPSFKATVDKEVLQTIPLQVKVKGGSAPVPSTPQGNGDQGKNDQRFVFVEREVPKNTMYVGEVLLSKVRLLHRVRLSGATPARDSSPEWRIISSDQQRNGEVVRDNVAWNTIEMTEGLVPLKQGKIKVPSFGINATWVQPTAKRRQSRSIFDMFQGGAFGMGEEVSRKLTSASIEMTVKPLPSPKPANFYDLVGAFTLSSDVSKRDLNVGDTTTVTIEIKGQGSLDRMRDLKLEVVGGKVYADKPQLEEKLEVGVGLASKKIFKFAVVPQSGGTVELGEIRISSFNPFTESYESLETKLGLLNVGGSGGAQVGNKTPSSTNSPDNQHPSKMNSSNGEKESQQSQASHPVQQSPIQPGSLSPKILTAQDGQATRPWYLAPLALAMEFLVLVVVVGFLIVFKVWKKFKMESATEKQPSKVNYAVIVSDLDQADEVQIDRAIGILKSVLAQDGQTPSALTSSDLVKNASLKNFSNEKFLQIKNLANLLDERTYGDSSDDIARQRLAQLSQVLKELIQYCADKNFQPR